jgi:hypothetical protein
MSDLTLPTEDLIEDPTAEQLQRMPYRDFVRHMRAAFKDHVKFRVFTEETTLERTRDALERMLASVDEQKDRIGDNADQRWLRRINSLRQLAKSHLDTLPVSDGPIVSGSAEARAWRTFAGLLAVALRDNDLTALYTLKAPYGGLSAAEWLVARTDKRETAE